jgi:hypothetical protein
MPSSLHSQQIWPDYLKTFPSLTSSVWFRDLSIWNQERNKQTKWPNMDRHNIGENLRGNNHWATWNRVARNPGKCGVPSNHWLTSIRLTPFSFSQLANLEVIASRWLLRLNRKRFSSFWSQTYERRLHLYLRWSSWINIIQQTWRFQPTEDQSIASDIDEMIGIRNNLAIHFGVSERNNTQKVRVDCVSVISEDNKACERKGDVNVKQTDLTSPHLKDNDHDHDSDWDWLPAPHCEHCWISVIADKFGISMAQSIGRLEL